MQNTSVLYRCCKEGQGSKNHERSWRERRERINSILHEEVAAGVGGGGEMEGLCASAVCVCVCVCSTWYSHA